MLEQMRSFLSDCFNRHFKYMEPSLRPVFYLSYIIQKQNTFHKILAQTLQIVAPVKLVPEILVKVKEKCEDFIKSSATLQQTYHFNQLPTLWKEPSTNSSGKHKLSCATEDKVEKVLLFFNRVFIEAPNYISSADYVPPYLELELEIKDVIKDLKILQRCLR